MKHKLFFVLAGLVVVSVIGYVGLLLLSQTQETDTQKAWWIPHFTKTAKTADSTASRSKPTKASPSPSPTAPPSVALNALALSPVSGRYSSGDTINVNVYENSGSTAVNAVQFAVKYNASQLEYTAIDATPAFDVIAATDSATPGQIRSARGAGNGALTGMQTVAVIHFRVKAGVTGTADVTIDASQSQLVRATDATDILQATSAARFEIR